MKKVRDIAAVAKGGFYKYVHDDNYPQQHPYFLQLKEMVRQYKLDNNLPIGLLFDDDFEDNVCAHAAEVTCEQYIPPGPMERLGRLGLAIIRAAKNGFKTVSAEVFQSRQDICSACNFYRGNNGILKIACGKCGCSGLKLHLASERCPIGRWT